MKEKKTKVKPEQIIEEMRLGWQRTQADFDNYRKRTETEKASWVQDGKIAAFESLLPVLDNLTIAVTHMENCQNDGWAQGIVHIANQIESTLAELGIEKIAPKPGDQFNPNFEEAVATQKSENFTKGCIISIEVVGYKIGQRLIRPAKVKVSE